MKTIDIHVKVLNCQLSELSVDDQELVERAKLATANSYSPYSHFRVGAALRLSDGNIVTGANQENAAFPSGLCAERTAIFAAQSQYPELAINTLAIAARSDSGFAPQPISPCGACLQVMLEVEHRYGTPMKVILYGSDDIYVIKSVKDMLPISFEEIPE